MSSLSMLPTSMRYLLDWSAEPVTVGRSDARTWRLGAKDQALFLKVSPVHPLSEAPGEAHRLQWLAQVGVPAPRLHSFEAWEGRYWLLQTALPGMDLTHWTDRPDFLVHALADALRALHSLEPASCPFDHRLAVRLADGQRNGEAGLVDESDFDQARTGWTTARVMTWLEANRLDHEDLVVTHGDASLPNFVADADGFSGFVDCGRLGVADRWQDLAIACRSLRYNLGDGSVAAFLAAYGADWDEERYRFFCTLDELF